jgi:hypothetical protein
MHQKRWIDALIVVDEGHRNKPVGMITPLDLRDEEYSEEGPRLAMLDLLLGSRIGSKHGGGLKSLASTMLASSVENELVLL